MLVFGAIDFAAAVARVGSFLGYRVTVCDARPVFATASRFPAADEVVVEWPHRYLAAEVEAGRVDPRTVVCVLTHDPKFDVPLLEVALRLPEVAYVGAMGSRRTHDDRLERLREAGVTDAELERLSSPIGLDLGARTPEETAVSIAAEIVALQWGGPGPAAAGDQRRDPPPPRRRREFPERKGARPAVACGSVEPLVARVTSGEDHEHVTVPQPKESTMTRVNVTVDGVLCSDDVEPRTLLVQYLRERSGRWGPSSAATRATAARAPCTSTAAA